MVKSVEAVLFDFGGTLFDFKPSNYHILGSVAREFGMDIEDTDPRLSLAFQKQEEYIHTLMLKKEKYSITSITPQDWKNIDDILIKSLGIHSQAAKQRLYDKFQERSYWVYDIFPDTFDTLKTLKEAGIKIGLVTNLGEKGVPKRYEMLDEFNLTQFFSSIVMSGEKGIEKPYPKNFLIALEELKIKDPSKVHHVGDSYYMDVQGARSAGITGVLLDTNKGRKCDCEIIGSPSGILSLLNL